MADVFISYSRKDKDFVRQVHDALAKLQREAWVDWEDIPLTAEWLQEIYAGIDSAHNFLFLITPESVVSPACRKEVDYAAANNKRLIPVLRRAVPDPDVPEQLAKINFVYFRESDPFDATFASLITALDADLAWITTHTRLLVRAKEWERKGKDKSFLLRGEDLREAENWQAEAGTKEPKATALHSQYILASRQAETRRQRFTLGSVVAALLVTLVLAIAALLQRNTARRQAAIARARQLAAQAELARATSPEVSALLSVESDALAPVAENTPVLQHTLPLLRKSVAVLQKGPPVQTVAFSPDGRFVATGDEGGSIRVFAVPGGKQLATYKQQGLVSSVAFSPDGQYLVAGSWDGTALIIQAASGKQSVLRHPGRVDALAFSPNGQFIATACWDKNAYVYEFPSGRLVAKIPHNEIVVRLAWDPSSRYVVTAGFDGRAKVADTQTGAVVQELLHHGAVNDVVFSPDGRYIATASWDGSARIFEAQTGKLASTIQLQNQVEAVAFSPDGVYLAVGGDDNFVHVYKVATGSEVSRLQHQLGVAAVAWSPDGRYVASASSDGTAFIFEPVTGKLLGRIEHPGKESGVNALAFSPDSQYLATSSFDGTARISRVIDATSQEVRLEHQGKLLSIALDARGDYLATGNWDDTVILSDTSAGTRLGSFKMGGAIYGLSFGAGSHYVAATIDNLPGAVQVSEVRGAKPVVTLTLKGESRVVAFSPDEKSVAAENEENVVQLFGLADGRKTVRFEHEARADTLDEIYAIALSPDGKFLLTSRSDMLVRVFEAATGKVLTRLKLPAVPLAMAFSTDGKYVIARLSDNTGLVFEPSTGKVIARLKPGGGVLAVAFSPDGRFVATGGTDQAAQVFELAEGRPVSRIEGPGPVMAVTFSADGKYLVSAAVENAGSDDKTVVVQRSFWAHESLTAQACGRLNRNFTPLEWQQYFPGETYHKTCPGLP